MCLQKLMCKVHWLSHRVETSNEEKVDNGWSFFAWLLLAFDMEQLMGPFFVNMMPIV